MVKIFDDVEKDVLNEVIISCGEDFAKENGKDEREEDIVLVYDFLQSVSRYELIDKVINKIREKGYEITKRS